MRNVEEDEVYEFRVAAINRAGEGPFSQGSNPVRAAERLGMHFYFRQRIICTVARKTSTCRNDSGLALFSRINFHTRRIVISLVSLISNYGNFRTTSLRLNCCFCVVL